MSVIKINGPQLTLEAYKRQLHLEQASGRADAAQVKKWTKKYDRFIEAASKKDVVAVLGTARDSVPTEDLINFSGWLFRSLVKLGISTATGHGDSGYMRVVADSVIRAWEQDIVKAMRASLFCVPLGFQGKSVEKPFRLSHHYPEVEFLQDPKTRNQVLHCSPIHLGLGTRADTLLGLPRLAAELYYPGGFGTLHEFATSAVSRQLKDGIATCHNNVIYPSLRFIIDDMDDQGNWLQEGLLEYLFQMCRFKTIDSESASDIIAIRIGHNEVPRPEYRGAIRIRYFSNCVDAANYVALKTIENIRSLAA